MPVSVVPFASLLSFFPMSVLTPSIVFAVNAKVASLVLEMWFRWHQSLWIYHAVSVQV